MPYLVLILSFLLTAPAFAKTYRWVDENGQVHYGDRIPPKYAQQQRQEINSRGLVVDEKNRAMTEEERAAERAKELAQQEEARKAAERERYDQFLLGTYATQDQILLRRDDQLGILDGQIANAEKALTQNSATLQDLQKRVDELEKGGKSVPDKLAKQHALFKRDVEAGEAGLKAMKDKRQQVEADFQRDLDRYIELTAKP